MTGKNMMDLYTTEQFLIHQIESKELLPTKEERQKKKECYQLYFYEAAEQIFLYFYSSNQAVRALECLSYLVTEAGIVRGDEHEAKGQISALVLEVQSLEEDSLNQNTYWEKRVNEYCTQVRCYFAETFSKDHESLRRKMRFYNKRTEGWFFVKSSEVAKAGEILRIKTLENSSGVCVTAADDVYIMIGCQGEVYDISRDKFLETYDEKDEYLDVFSQMFTYIPVATMEKNNEYVSLDQIAKRCEPKEGSGVFAVELDTKVKVFPVDLKKDYYFGNVGDYLAMRKDDEKDIYIIQRDVFLHTYTID